MAGNKTYISELQEQRNEELKKLEELKVKFNQIEDEENQQIRELEKKLAELEAEYEMNEQSKNELVFDIPSEEKTKTKLERWARHIKYEEIIPIATYLNLTLSLKRVPQDEYLRIFFIDRKESYSIE